MKIFTRIILLKVMLIILSAFSGHCQFIEYCYRDADGDGFGNPNDYVLTGILGCKSGYVTNNLDCNDNDAKEFPGQMWYEDADGDGYVTGTVFKQQCNRPSPSYKTRRELFNGRSIYCGIQLMDFAITRMIDCDPFSYQHTFRFTFWLPDNDQDGAPLNLTDYYLSCDTPRVGGKWVNTGSKLFCNPSEVIADCNDNDPLQKPGQGWYLDGDNDGFPLNNTPEFLQCQKPAGPYKSQGQLISLAEDCNDANASIYPRIWHEDKDGDGNITGNTQYACIQPAGYIDLKGNPGLIDCDDTDPRATIVQGWYPDADGDGFGGNGVTACKGPSGYFTRFELQGLNDCNDNNNKIFPGATEFCNGADDNCNREIDEKYCCPTTHIVYVKPGATGANNGTTWINAFGNLQDALELARRCNGVEQIWVAGGTYYPDEGGNAINNNKDFSFAPRSGLAIYGGFAGNESTPGQRSLTGSPSILSGEIQQNALTADNTTNVLVIDNISGSLLIDGFTIQNGFSTIVLPVNRARGMGVLIANSSGTVIVRNCIITRNTGTYAAAIATTNASPLFVNCLVTANNSSNGSGTIWNENASPHFMYCSVGNNEIGSTNQVVVYNTGNASPVFTNSIVRGTTPAMSGGTPSVTYSLIQSPSVWPGTGNLNTNPLFMDESGSDLRLQPCSPAINAGVTLFTITTDLLGLPRGALGKPDMGAYERQAVQVMYVDSSALPNGDGSSWSSAYKSLQEALQSTCANVNQVWVAKGTYRPTTDSNRDSAFALRNNLAIYGGFAGNETQVSQRNLLVNRTILSGDIGIPNNSSDNSHNVIFHVNNGLNETAILDGFTITGGNANKPAYHRTRGAGVHNFHSSPAFYNCIITGNTAAEYGGGMFNEGSSTKVVNSVFSGNVASFGGGLYNESATSQLINVSMSGNKAFNTGGAFYSYGVPAASITNSIIWGNSSGIQIAGGSTPATVSYSIVQNGYAGTSNLNVNPVFTVQPLPAAGTTGDLRLQACSPAINAGNNAGLPASTTMDITGAPRVINAIIDMGAFERQSATQSVTIYIDANAEGMNDGTNWANAYTTLEAALSELNGCQPGTTVMMATGIYTAHANTMYTFDKLNAIILGGYPTGGGSRNPVANPVVIKGNVQVLKSVQMDGVKVQSTSTGQ